MKSFRKRKFSVMEIDLKLMKTGKEIHLQSESRRRRMVVVLMI
jgi:hypothetical protein